MALDLLNKTDFYSFAGFTSSDVNDAYVTKLIDSVNASIEKKIGDIFQLTPDTTKKYYKTVASTIALIGNWQDDITLTLKEDGSTDVLELTEGDDYRLFYFDQEELEGNTCVVAVKLYTYRLTDLSYLEISGTYGFSDGVPADLMLDIDIYDLIKKAVLGAEIETESGGQGGVVSSSIDKVRVQFDNTKTMSFKEAFSMITDILDTVKDQYTYKSQDLPSIIG